jgi:hypothetical protein
VTTREHRLRSAVDSSSSRLVAAAGGDDEQAMFNALGEWVGWVCALDTLFEGTPNYKSRRNNDDDGTLLRGLRYVRNQILHGVEVVDIAESAVVPAPRVVIAGAGSRSQIVLPPTRIIWTFKATLPPLPAGTPSATLEPHYADVAGKEAVDVVRAAVG